MSKRGEGRRTGSGDQRAPMRFSVIHALVLAVICQGAIAAAQATPAPEGIEAKPMRRMNGFVIIDAGKANADAGAGSDLPGVAPAGARLEASTEAAISTPVAPMARLEPVSPVEPLEPGAGADAQEAADSSGGSDAVQHTTAQGSSERAMREEGADVLHTPMTGWGLAISPPDARTMADAQQRPVVDSLPEQQDGLSLKRFYERMARKALAISPSVREAQAQWHAAQHDVAETKGQRWPQVQVGLSSSTAQLGGSPSSTSRSAAGNVQVVTPLFDWGRIQGAIDQRSKLAEAASANLSQVRQQVVFDTVNGIMELRRQRAARSLSTAYVDRMGELVDMLSEIVKVDHGRTSELTQARGRRLQAMAARDIIEAKLREVEIALERLVGEPVSLPDALSFDGDPVQLADALQSMKDHPALVQARAEADAATHSAQVLRAAQYPQLNWVVSKTTEKDTLGQKQPWETGLSVQWTAFQGGAASAAERAALERASAGDEKVHVALRDLEYRLRTTVSQRDSAISRTREYDALIRDSDEVRKNFYEQWYHLGKRTLLDVLTAEGDYYTHQVAQVNSGHDAQAADLKIRADAAILVAWLLGGERGSGAVVSARSLKPEAAVAAAGNEGPMPPASAVPDALSAPVQGLKPTRRLASSERAATVPFKMQVLPMGGSQ